MASRLAARRPVDPSLAQPRRDGLRQLLGLGALGLTGCASRPPLALQTPPGGVAPFSAAEPGSALPQGWQPYIWRRDRPTTRYTVVADQRRHVLHALAAGAASGLQCPVHLNASGGAQLHFSWRIEPLPGAASVEALESDDAPARIVVAFDGDMSRLSLRERLLADQVELFTGHRMPYATLMYVWDGALAPETLVHNRRSSRVRYLTVESGNRRSGQWLHYERDLVADYQRAFGESPGRVLSVGVLTDSDATKHLFQAWYGDISLLAARPA